MMHTILFRLVVICTCSSAFISGVTAAYSTSLSIPEHDRSNATKRKAAIRAIALKISNKPRFQTVKGVAYPFPPGPLPVKGSLAEQITAKELQLLDKNENPNIDNIFIEAAITQITTFGDYLKFYQRLATKKLITVPLTALDFSDAAFGEDRLTIKGFRLRQVKTMVKTSIPLTPVQLDELCGARSLKELVQQKRLYAEDLSFAARYNDKSRPKKYVPSVKGYFCVNRKKQFFPMAIHILDSKLVYTPFDKAIDWKFAKMALNAAGACVQPWDHFLESHIMMEPIRVEMMRTMSSRHPVYALMEHHFLQLFGNSVLGLNLLLNANTTVDFTFGWGTTGSLRFIYDESQSFHFTKKFFINQIRANGLNNIPNAKLFTDSQNVFDAIRSFVRDFVTLYYSHKRGEKEHRTLRGPAHDTDAAIAGDSELQSWLSASGKIVPGFPSKLTTTDGLVNTLSNLIFRTSVLHHAMNSDVLWHTYSFPYSLPGLFAPLPKKKGQSNIQLADFVMPQTLFPEFTGQSASYLRPFRPAISILHSYDSVVFNKTAHQAITKYRAKLERIESKIAEREKNRRRPYNFMKPSRLPHYVWI